ncbi:MAG: hypothetical protein KC410_03675 [Anaerolineales bacterium]|uniref:hypothetical protein n=1 Tax=Promineifilum sp. TaxID=2664178 RepID=UPI001D6060FB|nr:hypothetical protein [Anaerolineales bacterium]MCB8935749.1 hypothetical protein [Promineifilum sp.]MCO5179550.1 hypothetical protein [Promineifilum sp.]
MSDKPHIVRVVADEARRMYFRRRREREALPRPRIRHQEIGVEFVDQEFIPYADLGYNSDIGFFRLSQTFDVPNEAAPFAAAGRLIDPGGIVVTTGASHRLTNDEIGGLLERHVAGDYGEFGQFYNLDVDDAMLTAESLEPADRGTANKVHTLTGLDTIVSAYTVREHCIWVITEAGENRTTLLLFAGPARG